jgi:hypothetical protein
MMKSNYTRISVIGLVLVAVMGMGAYAFADRGKEYGHYGPGWHHRQHFDSEYGYECPRYSRPCRGDRAFKQGHGFRGNLGEDQIMELEQERRAFIEATRDLRNMMFDKKMELRREMAAQSPDAAKAAELQKEISGLKAEFDQKRIEHRIKMKKINPDAGRSFGARGRKGFGGRAAGPCW